MGTDFGLRATFEQVLSSLVGAVADFVPRLVTAVIVILFGLLVAKIAERVVRALFERLRLNHLLQRVGLSDTLQRFGLRDSPGRLLSRTIYILLVVLFVQSVARAVGLDAIAEAISSFFRYLPNLVAAFLVLLLGMMVSQFMGRTVARSAEEAGVDFAPLLGRIVSSLLLFVVGLMAISQLKIDTEIVRAVVLVLLAGFALAFALSFGLGSRQVSRDILAGFYLRKLLSAGDEVEVAGTRGTLAGITAVHTLIEVDGRTVSVPNRQFMDERAGYRRD